MTRSFKLLSLYTLSWFVVQCGGQESASKPRFQSVPPTQTLSTEQQATAETEQNWETPWVIQIDQSIFNHQHTGVFSSDKYDKAVITVAMAPSAVPFAEQKKRFLERKPKQGETFKGIVNIGGREVLLRKSLDTVENLTLAVRQYLMDAGNGQLLMLSASCKPEDDSALDKTFQAAVQSFHAK